MNKTIKRNVLVSAILAIMLCVSLIAGATFALFTSESKVNIAVTSGKVSVTATIDQNSVETKQLYDTAYKAGANNMYEASPVFADNDLTLEKLVPGDGIKFNIVVKNESNITVQYRTIISCANDNGLFAGLNITVGDNVNYSGVTLVSDWAQLAVGSADEIVPVTIELPEGAGNEYQDLSCKLAFTVNAVQGNAAVTQPEEDVTYLYNASDLRLFEKSVNSGNSYVGKTVKLMDDVDLAGIEWKPVGQTTGYSAATYFQGTFDGNGKTISNLTIGESSWEEGSNEGKNFATGFFGFIDMSSTTIKNVTFDNANVEGHHWVGVVAGYMTGTIENVVVKNSTVTSTYKTSEADGDKAGGVTGYLNSGSVTGCRVENSTVTAVRDCGSIVGFSTNNGNVTGNTAQDCTVYYSTDDIGKIGGEIAGKRANGVSDNTATNVTVSKLVTVSTASELSAALNKTYTEDTTVMLTKDITLTGKVITTNGITEAYGNKVGVAQYGGTLDGNGNSLTETGKYAYVIVTHGGTIKNINIVGGGRGIVIYAPTEDVIIDNVVIDGPGYAINTAEHNGQDLIVTNSTIKGWTSLAGLDSVSFTGCLFGENSTKCWQNSGYGADYDRLIRPYGQASFTDCTFEKNFYIDLSSLANGNTVTLTNCNCEGVVLTAENYANYITVELPDWATSIADCIVFN